MVGYKIIATIKDVKGLCNQGHKVGDSFKIDGHDTGGLCGFFYHDIFPDIMLLQFGGGYPATWHNHHHNPDVIEAECRDRRNAVTIELKRIRE
jgi:uncharacterized repeat protein (TIGR04076 family)